MGRRNQITRIRRWDRPRQMLELLAIMCHITALFCFTVVLFAAMTLCFVPQRVVTVRVKCCLEFYSGWYKRKTHLRSDYFTLGKNAI